MLNPIFKSLSELNISFLPNALASRNYLKAFLKCLLTIFKRISKVIPSQASVLFFILFNFQGPCCLSRQPLYITTTLFSCQHFFQSFLKSFSSLFLLCPLSCDSLYILARDYAKVNTFFEIFLLFYHFSTYIQKLLKSAVNL